MDEPERTLAGNAVVFREINEKIGATARAMAHDGSLLTFLCECSSLDCAERLLLRWDEYEYVRARGECFIVVRGHEVADIERTVEQHTHYDVIETTGESAAHARARNPRRESMDG